jgi:hypothetical protein
VTQPRQRKIHFDDHVYGYMFSKGGQIVIEWGSGRFVSLSLGHQEPNEECDFIRCRHAITPKHIREVIELERAGKLVRGTWLSEIWTIGTVERTGRKTHHGRGDVVEQAKRKAARLVRKRAVA